MNKRGFTIVEVLGVVVLLGLIFIIATPLISNSGKNAKIKILQTKVENIKKAAVLYAQEENVKFDANCNQNENDVCFEINNCKCSETNIKVRNLIDGGYIDYDEGTSDIKNPVDESQSLLECEILIYRKYERIYAVYVNEDSNNETCWVKE